MFSFGDITDIHLGILNSDYLTNGLTLVGDSNPFLHPENLCIELD
jgi:hypothetical protein